MVCDHIKYASEYFNLSHGIRYALEYLQSTDVGALDAGRHELHGDRVFALVSDYDTRAPEETFWEAHRRHVDVQCTCTRVRSASATANLAAFEAEPYDEVRDLLVARGNSSAFVEVGAGGFVILFPHDVHMPGLIARAVERVRKIVVKVRL